MIPASLRTVPALGAAAVLASVAIADDPAADLVVTLQGRLIKDGVALNTPADPPGQGYDFTLRLWSAESGGVPLTPPLFCSDVFVESGLFSIPVDFGPILDGAPKWVEIEVDADPSDAGYDPVLLGRVLVGRTLQAEWASFAANGPERNGATPDSGDYLFLGGAIGVGTPTPDVLLEVAGSEIRATRSLGDPVQHVAIGVLDGTDGFSNAVVSRSGQNNAKPLIVRSEWEAEPYFGDPSIRFDFGPAGGPFESMLTLDPQTGITASSSLDVQHDLLVGGRIGIGVETLLPTLALDVNGRTIFRGNSQIETDVTAQGNPVLWVRGEGPYAMRLQRTDLDPLYSWLVAIDINGSGGGLQFLQPADAVPTLRLDDSGNAHVAGTVFASNFVPPPSDERLKRDREDLAYGLDEILALHPIRYRWRQDTRQARVLGDRPELGFTAQEVRAVCPEAVSEDVDGMLRLDYDRLVPVLVRAIQEQQDAIESRDARIEDLEARLARLEAMFDERDAQENRR